MASTYFFASGKGGAGKSTITAGIGTALARLGSKVVIIDADIGLRGQDAFLCLDNNVVYDIVDVIRKDCGLDQALLQCPDIPGLFLLPASPRNSPELPPVILPIPPAEDLSPMP